mgnify:CR=1 FL=1|jgi:hypothetical protein|tara:strand:- start:471 stop:1043 length:573 start_codon:yes stop_codon:yes gene_type:complete
MEQKRLFPKIDEVNQTLTGLTPKSEGLNTKIDRLVELIEEKEKKKEKKFKLPFNKSFGAKPKIKRNYVLVFLLRTNGKMVIRFLPIEEMMVHLKENDTYHEASPKYIGYYKNYPVMILPEWSVRPISKERLIEQDIKEGTTTLGQKVAINAMKLSQLKKKTNIMGSGMFWLVIGGIVVLYFIYTAVTGQG